MTATVEGRRRFSGLRGFREFLTRRPGFLRNVIIFFVTGVVGLVAFAGFVGKEDLILPWEHEVTYYADFSDASAIAPGQHQEIRVAGVHVGDIGTATVYRHGIAHVQLQITQKGLKLYQNASVLLQAKTPLNEMYMELNPGSPPAPMLKPGATISIQQTTSPIEVDQILQHLGPNVQAATTLLLNATNTALTNASDHLPTDLQATSNTFSSLQPLAQALQTRDSEIKSLVSDLTQIANAAGSNQARLASLLSNAQTTLNTLQSNDSGLSATLQALPQTTQALGTNLPKVQALSGQLNPLLDNVRAASGTLPNALGTLNATLKNLNPLLTQLRPVIASGNPLVSNLRQYLGQVGNPSLGVLNQIGLELGPLTNYTAYDMPWLNGFFYNTNSLTSTQTSNGKPEVRSLEVVGGTSGNGLCSSIASSTGQSSPNSLAQQICSVIGKAGGQGAP
jgi:phospholipid/cholesterol/gamma-HCH transport system substrate-binding protein